ncbi:MAG: diguanylate cyclase [Oscillospiraceae bacterium]|nr:diguanylate cyclase [Oscillospiraceae bacterium]
MADNVLFGTKVKLMAFIIAVAVLPLILLSIATSSVLDEYDTNLAIENSQSVAYVASEGISDYFDRLVKLSETMADDPDIAYFGSGYSENIHSVLNNLLDIESSLDAVLLLDKNANISESSAWKTGYNLPTLNASQIENDIKFSGGISSIKEHTALDKIIISSYIKNDTGDVIGFLSLVADMSVLSGYVTNEGIGEATRLIICDNSGNILSSNNTSTKPYSEISEFNKISKQFEKIISGKFTDSYTYETGSGEQLMVASTIPTTTDSSGLSWSVVVITNEDMLSARYNSITSSLNSSVWAISVLVIVVVIVFVIWFARPISNVMRIMSGGEINISSQRVIVNGNTEMDNINRQINVLLDALSESEQRYRTVVDMTDNIVFEYSIPKDTVSFSNNFNKKFSFRAVSLKYEDSFFVKANVFADDLQSYKKFVSSMIEGQNTQGEFRFRTIYNDYAWYLVRCASIRDSYNKIIKIVGVMLNIDKTKAREQQLMNKASLDPLTQAYNRESFELALQNEFELSSMRNGKDAVLFIDLDNFKRFNDEYNHTVGDEVLVFTVNLCRELVGKNGFVGRQGGDEFVVCFRETADLDAPLLAQRIISGLSDGFVSPSTGEKIVMFCSIGVAYLAADATSPSEIIDRADNAMYSVKRSGKSNYTVYKEET